MFRTPLIDIYTEKRRRDKSAIGGGAIVGKDLYTRTGFADPVARIVPGGDIEKRIIELHQVDKMGAEAIAKKLTEEGFQISRAPVGRVITRLKKAGTIEDIPYAERKAAIDQRGEFYNKPASEKYLAIREVRDIDRTTRFKDTGKLKYNIPKDAKFKIDFKNPTAGGADVTGIPSKFQGVQYYKTKQAAENALKARKKLKLIEDVDPDSARRSANKKKYDLVKEVSNNNIEEKLTDFKVGEPLEQAHRLSLQQVKKTGELYNVMNLGLDFDDPEFVQINNEAVKPYENKLKQLYKKQDELYKKAIRLDSIPKELRKQIELNNFKISTVVDLSGGRVQGLQLDEFTLKPKVTGTNYANVLGFGLYDKPVKDLTDVDRAEIGAIMQGQIENEKRTAGKTAAKLFANKDLLKKVDTLAIRKGFPDIKLASEIEQPEKSKTRDMYKNAFKGERGFVSTDLLKDVGKGAGKLLTAAGTPLGVVGITAGFGIDPTSAVDRATLGAEAALAPSLVKGTNQLTKNALLRRLFNLGLSPQAAMRAARIASPLGIASLGGEALYQYGKFVKDELERIENMTPEEREAYNVEQEEQMGIAAANGGLITRQAFKDGFDPKKRQTMKILGGLASIPVLGKYVKILGPLAPKVVETVERGSDAVPTFLYDLIAKVKAKGMKFFTGNRADEFEYVYERDGYQVREQGNKITVRKRIDDGEMLDKDMEMELEVDPETGGLTYKEATARPDAEGKLKDVEEYIEDVDLEEMKKYTYDE